AERTTVEEDFRLYRGIAARIQDLAAVDADDRSHVVSVGWSVLSLFAAGSERRGRLEHLLDPGTDFLNQFIAPLHAVFLRGDGLAEAKDNRPRSDAPPALGQDPTGAEDGDGDDLDAGVEREHERALLEGEQLSGRRASPLGEDDDGAVVLPQQLAGLVQRLDGRSAVAPVDRNVAGGLPRLPEDRDHAEFLLGDEAVALRDRRGERPDVEPGDVVRREDLGPVRIDVLRALDGDGRAADAQHHASPRSAGPVVDAAADAEQRRYDDDRGQEDGTEEEGEVCPDGTDQRLSPAKWRYPSTSGGTMEPSLRCSATPGSSRTVPTRVSTTPNESMNSFAPFCTAPGRAAKHSS